MNGRKLFGLNNKTNCYEPLGKVEIIGSEMRLGFLFYIGGYNGKCQLLY